MERDWTAEIRDRENPRERSNLSGKEDSGNDIGTTSVALQGWPSIEIDIDVEPEAELRVLTSRVLD